MFWRFGGYASTSTIDNLLDKVDVTVEELLDEADLIQELKQHNSKLIEYLREEPVLRKLLDYVVAPSLILPGDGDVEDPEPSKGKTFSPVRTLSIGRSKEEQVKLERLAKIKERETADKARQKYAYVACEVLSSETWSIIEALMENREDLVKFWSFLRQDPALDPIAAGYFTKINETLLDKKTEDTLDFVKNLDGIIPVVLTHVDCPMVMDLLLKIISLEKAEGGQGIVDWLQNQDLMPMLLGYLCKDHLTFTQTAAGDFIKAIITISANASQNEQSCIGPNSLTRELVSEVCSATLLTEMLRGGNPLTVGVGIIIEVIRKNNSDYDPDVGAGQDLPPSSSDPIFLGTLLRHFADHIPDFIELLLSPNHTITSGDSTMVVKRKNLKVASGAEIEPLGFDRFKTCELMAELLHCSNMSLLNEPGSEARIKLRDQHREQLKAAGELPSIREPQSAVTDFSESSVTFQNEQSYGDDQADELNKSDLANSAEDDGFEDVGTSSDLAEDMKDEFDEKTPFELEGNEVESMTPTKLTKPRLDLDEEFFDEPLTSPRLEAVDEKDTELFEQPETVENSDIPSTLSSEALAADIKHLDINEQDSSEEPQRPPPVTVESPESIFDTPHMKRSKSSSNIAPPLPERRSLNTAVNNQEPGSPVGISPHPDDKPAPLFSGKAASPTKESAQNATETSANDPNTLLDNEDTTMGQNGESVLLGHDESFTPQLETDEDGQPIVGDYLKLMFVKHKVVPTILDFFFRFPWNNFLHNVVYDVVQQVFNGPMDRGYNRSLAIDLFTTGRITEQIIEGQARNDEAQATHNMRLGYMGHLTLISEEVVKFTERHGPEVLGDEVLAKIMTTEWTNYVGGPFNETRERDAAILGGHRPEVNIGARQTVLNAVNSAGGFGGGASSALANAGLNGGGGGLDLVDLASSGNASTGTFGNSLLSGFGSSSDEEDEEMEDVGEHDESGEGTTEQYPSYHSSSLSALSIFSPPLDSSTPSQAPAASDDDPSGLPPPLPPPLNIPPSRARRQLAARLALHGHTSPFSSPEASPHNPDAPPSNPPISTGFNVLSPDSLNTSNSTRAQRELVREAIDTNKSETPFGDLENLTVRPLTGMEGFDEDDEELQDDDDDDDDDGEDVPITIAMPTRRLSAQSSPKRAHHEPTTFPAPSERSNAGEEAKKATLLGESTTSEGETNKEKAKPRSPRDAAAGGKFSTKMSELFSSASDDEGEK